MACVILVRQFLKTVGTPKMVREKKYRIESDNTASTQFSRELYGLLNISSFTVSKKTPEVIGSEKWTRINTRKDVPVYWEYRILGPGESDMSDHFTYDHSVESKTFGK